MKWYYFLLLFFCVAVSPVAAQKTVLGSGNIEIFQDNKITKLADQYRKINKYHFSMDGYRVQVYFESGNNSKKLANDAATQFMANYPEMKAYVSFRQPYYRVRVGNFRTIIEAVGFQKQIQAEYPGAFPVKEKITYPDL
jgi:hypothetical protein